MLEGMSILALGSICLLGALFGLFLAITNNIPKAKSVKIFFWIVEAFLIGGAATCFISLIL